MRRGQQISPASFTLAVPTQRFLARFIDLVVIAAALFAALVAGFLSLPEGWFWGPEEPQTPLQQVAEIMAIALVLAAVLYEIATTAWRGRTVGKRAAGIQVLRHHNGHVPSLVRSIIRWIIPHIALIVGAAAEAVSSDPVPLFVTPAYWMLAGLAWWLLVPASSLWDPQSRGWNDKAAGTIVVASPR